MSTLAYTVQTILADCRTIASSGTDAATARANVREAVKGLFPPKPLQSDIDAIVQSDDWKELDTGAREIFAVAYFSAPREIDGDMVDLLPEQVALYQADKKAAKGFTESETRIRKKAQDYVRTAVKQNITQFIPVAVDAKPAEKVEKLPDANALLAAFVEGLITLSEKSPDTARALHNATAQWIEYARPYIAQGKAIPRKG